MVGPWRSGTHRVQLPLEYNEGHETNNDKYGAEAQVGEDVAREVTWEDREDKVRTGSKAAWPQASQVGPGAERLSQQGPRGQGQVPDWGRSRSGGPSGARGGPPSGSGSRGDRS